MGHHLTMKLHERVVFITGASRGIGRAIALRCARDGARVVLAAKTVDPHPTLPGTILSVADEVRAAGGEALPVQLDVRDADAIEAAVAKTVETFGRIDALVNNAGAIWLAPVPATPPKRFDLMNQINYRATFLCTRACLPHLERSDNPHVLNMSPPLDLDPGWFEGKVAYTISKFSMSMCTLGMAAEFRPKGIAVNSLWPRTIIDTEALRMVGGRNLGVHGRKPEIMADAAYAILTSPAREVTGRFFIDEEALAELAGVTDFEPYAVDPTKDLLDDLYVTRTRT